MIKSLFVLAAAAGLASTAVAEPVSYDIDPSHTFPSFEADHMGISKWRGKLNTNSGIVVLDKAKGTGRVEVTIDLAGIDFGQDELNTWGRSADFFDVVKFPRAKYVGTLQGFVDGAPTRVEGELTLHGVTRAVPVTIKHFKCIPHPLHQRELCGADAWASFKRDEFGLTAGKDYGFDMTVDLRIQIEAVVPEKAADGTVVPQKAADAGVKK